MLKTSREKPKAEFSILSSEQATGSFSLLWLLLALITTVYSSLTVLPFLTNLLGLGILPPVALIGAGLGVIWLCGWAVRQKQHNFVLTDGAGAVVSILAFSLTLLYCFTQAAPYHFLPVGTTVDSTHHFILADFIKSHQALPLHPTPTEAARLLEMQAYPPAFHLVVALISTVSGIDLAYVMFPLVAFLASLISAGVAALSYVLLPSSRWRPIVAFISACAAYLASGFFFDPFMYWDFYGQIAAFAALILGLYFTLHYFTTSYFPSLVLSTLAAFILTLAYTHWLPLLALPLLAAPIASKYQGVKTRTQQLASTIPQRIISTLYPSFFIALCLGVFGILFLKDRLNGTIVWTGGAGANFQLDGGLIVPVLLVLSLGALGLVGFYLSGRLRSWLPRLMSAYSLLVLIGGCLILLSLGRELSSFNLARLYPFDASIWLLVVLATGGAVLALLRGRPLLRFYLIVPVAVTLEIMVYLFIRPGGTANAYHLSKMYTVLLVLIAPTLLAPVLEAFFTSFPGLKKQATESHHNPKSSGQTWQFLILLACLVMAFLSYALLNFTSPDRSHGYAGPDIIATARAVQRLGYDPAKVELDLQPGLPAYFTYVGLLGQPRNVLADGYYKGQQRHSFETWLYDPLAPTLFLTDSYLALQSAYPQDARTRLLYRSGPVALISRSPGYLDNLVNRRTFFLNSHFQAGSDVLTVDLELGAVLDVFTSTQLFLSIGPRQEAAAPLLNDPFYKRNIALTLPTVSYNFQRGYLKFRFQDGYSRGEMNGQELGPDKFTLGPGEYTLWMQLYKDGQPIEQRKVEDFAFNSNRTITPLPLSEGAIALPEGLSQLRLEAPLPAPTDSPLTPTNAFFQQGERRLIQLTDWSVVPASAHPGQTVHLSQRYRSLADISPSYTLFVHLVDEGGTTVASSEEPPAHGLFPTWLWQPGQTLTIDQELTLPADLPPGSYSLQLGFYTGPDATRLDTWAGEPAQRIWESHFRLPNVLIIS